MSPIEFWAFWGTVGLYTLASAVLLAAMIFKRSRWLRWGGHISAAGMVGHLITVIARILYTGHIPVASEYENAIAISLVVMLFAQLLVWRRPGIRVMLVSVVPFCLLMLGFAFLKRPSYTTMSIVLDNMWMFVHIFFAQLAYGAYAVAAGLGVLYLIAARHQLAEGPVDERASIYQKLPALPLIDEILFRVIIFGFITHVVMVASGSIWARDLWGSYWSWDPVETWSFISWLLYGLWIHLRLTFGWRGRRMAILAIATLITVLIAFWGTNLFGTTSHSLDDLKIRQDRGFEVEATDA